MSNRTFINKRLNNSLLEEENSIFKEKKVQKEPTLMTTKEKLPKPVFQKRAEKEITAVVFYSVLTLISFVSMGTNLYFATFIGFVSSLLATVFSLYCLLYTNPDKWLEDRNDLAFWNASVTMSVLIKSTHFKIFQWRKVFMYGFAGGLALSYFISQSMTGVFGALFLLTGLTFLAERNFEDYSKVAFILAWISVPALILALILTKGIPLGVVITALLLYQVYERVRSLKIAEPWVEK